MTAFELTMPAWTLRGLLLCACLAAWTPAPAQSLPDGPLLTPDGRLTVGGELTVTGGGNDEVAYFNYTDYEHNTLRMVRLSTSAIWRPAAWLTLAADLRSEDLERPALYAAYGRVRPWPGHDMHIDVGRIPPVFGAFARRAYASDNPVIGYPLAYQYLTSLHTDALPATTGDLLKMRARGWRSSFPVGTATAGPGIPLVSGFRWDTGVGAGWTGTRLALAAAVTSGTLANPRVRDDNAGKQVSARAMLTPVVGLVLGVSAAAGPWLARPLERGGSPQQRTLGADVEYSRAHWVLRSEIVLTRWALPASLPPAGVASLGAAGSWVEGRYRLTPRIFVAGRLDRLTFSRIRGAPPSPSISWDAPVSRLEAGAGYYLRRNLTARADVQGNRRDGGRVRRRTFLSAQLAYWF